MRIRLTQPSSLSWSWGLAELGNNHIVERMLCLNLYSEQMICVLLLVSHNTKFSLNSRKKSEECKHHNQVDRKISLFWVPKQISSTTPSPNVIFAKYKNVHISLSLDRIPCLMV
jgi:hypothetical protein